MPRRPLTGALAAVALMCGCGGAAPVHKTPDPPPANVKAQAAGRAQLLAAEQRAIDRTLRYTSYVSAGSPRRNDVALTFDDGPGPDTPRLLALLRAEHVPATFFQMGRAVREYPQVARATYDAGYAVGDHTATHPFLSRLGSAAQRAEIIGAARTISADGGPFPRLFRPPYGAFNAATLQVARAEHMLMVLWTVDTKDFSRPGTNRIVYTALSGARAGAIILMHDGGGPRGQTLAALPRIIRGLRKRHMHIVTVPRLLMDDPPLRHQPPPRSLAGRF